MSSGVLKSQIEIDSAKEWLLTRFQYKHPDPPKAWDLVHILQWITTHVPIDAHILDLGAVGCPVTLLLKRSGYRHLEAVDLSDALVHKIPFWVHRIRYSKQNIHHTSFLSESFDCLTCISVIEHGVDLKQFAQESSRLLKPGGFVLISFDYWPQKIKTDDIMYFGLPWTIFSKTQIQAFIRQMTQNGFSLIGKPDWTAKQPLVHWFSRDYTFGLAVFQKK